LKRTSLSDSDAERVFII